MKRIPHAKEVRQALQAVQKAVSVSREGINEAAADRMARGDYGGAEELVAKGREAEAFEAEIGALRKRWQELVGGGGRRQSNQSRTTPLWAYYQPLLEALVELGGEARRAELEPQVERRLARTLQPADRDPMARGQERWQVMIRRARKHLASEGWIEGDSSPVWRVTEAGRRTASQAGSAKAAGGSD